MRAHQINLTVEEGSDFAIADEMRISMVKCPKAPQLNPSIKSVQTKGKTCYGRQT